MSWTLPTPVVPDGPMTGPERPILTGYLAWERATLRNICAGLSGEQLAMRPLPASNLSLLGLLRHLAKVERIWFRQRMAGEDVAPLFDPSLGKDADFDRLDPAEAEPALAAYEDECRAADAAVADVDLDATVEVHGEAMSLRMIYIHLIGEYARHNGHADLLREHIDGATGR